ncbi:MAG: hypothetical protein R2822_04020 [Spirosomataceae bacterium]
MKPLVSITQVKVLQVLNWVFFICMIAANYLANALPFNNKTTGELSDQYPNLFVPAPITFAIWGVIYTLLLVFCVKQSKSLLSRNVDEATAETIKTSGLKFIFTCILNTAWILAWHYEYVLASVFIMLLLLWQLISINRSMTKIVPYFSNSSRFVLKASFGVYLGWICIATVANITAALVNYNWNSWGQGEVFWAVVMVLVGALIGSIALLKLNNAYIGLSVIWAFIGVILARMDAPVYHRFIVWSAVFAIVLVIIAEIIEVTRALFRTAKTKDGLESNPKPTVVNF